MYIRLRPCDRTVSVSETETKVAFDQRHFIRFGFVCILALRKCRRGCFKCVRLFKKKKMLKINYTDACNWVNKYLSHTKQKHWPTLCHKKSFFSGFTICITMHQDFSHPELRRWNNMQFPAKWAKVQKKRFFFLTHLENSHDGPQKRVKIFPVR